MSAPSPLQHLEQLASGPNADTVLLRTDARTWSYASSFARVVQYANGLAQAGVKPGDRIALCVDTYDVFFLALLGAWRLGCTVAPVNLSLPDDKLDAIWARLHADAIVWGGDVPADTRHWPDVPVRAIEPSDAEVSACPLAPDALALVTFTSGTTGTPKGVCQSMSSVWMNACLTASFCELTCADRVFINTPPYYTSALCHFLTMLAAGGGLCARKGFLFGESLVESMVELGANGFGGAPAHAIRVVDSGVTIPDSIRFWVSSGDKLPVHTQQRMREAFPHIENFVMYGLTETAGRLCMMNATREPERVGSVGRALEGMTVVAVGDSGERLAAGDIGELHVQGPMVMSGYLDDEARTAAALTPMGFRTGDFGAVDTAGCIWIHGRQDDIIKCGAEKVSLLEVQHVLLSIDGVQDAAAIAAQDDIMGTVCEAYVVRAPGADVGLKTLRNITRQKMPPSHCPRRFHFVDEIPRSGAGKLLRQNIGNT